MTAIGTSSIPTKEVTFLPMSRITESHAIPEHFLPVIGSPECLDVEIASDREIENAPLSSDVARKAKIRTRRVFGQIKGNNKVGRRGKLKCLECRKIRLKCTYISENEICDYCAPRLLHCEKVWGPVRTERMQREIAEQEAYTSLAYYPLSLIVDLNLSAKELFYFRYLYFDIARQPFSVEGILHRYLWGIYGFSFSSLSNQSLRYIAMSYAAIEIAYLSRQPISTDYYENLSRFHESILRALKEDIINESHLVALHYAIRCSKMHSILHVQTSETRIYSDFFVAVLKHLSSQFSTSTIFPSQYIWKLMLSFLRRTYPFTLTIYADSVEDSVNRQYSMHLVDIKLPGEATNLGIVERIIGYPYSKYIYLYWDTRDMISSLKAGFMWSYSVQRYSSGPQADFAICNVLNAISDQTNGFEKLGFLRNELEVLQAVFKIDLLDAY